MSGILRGFYEIFIYRKKQGYLFTLDPLAKILTLLIQLIGIFLGDHFILLLVLALSSLEGVLNGIHRKILHGLRGVALPLLLVICLVGLFYNLIRAIRVLLLIICFITTITVFTSTTSPSNIVRALEKVGIPLKVAYVPALAIKLIPEIATAAQDALLSFTLRGEIKSRVHLGSISKVLTAISAASLTKTRYLGEALAVKGFSSERRVNIYSPHVGWKELLRLGVFISLPLLQFLVGTPSLLHWLRIPLMT